MEKGSALLANRRSFDCASRDETARGSAQDDNFYINPLPMLTLCVDTLGGRDVFAEAEEVAVWAAEHELVHLTLAWGEGGEDFDSCCLELGFECGGGSVARIEIELDDDLPLTSSK